MTTDFLILLRISGDVVAGVFIGIILGGISLALKGRESKKTLQL